MKVYFKRERHVSIKTVSLGCELRGGNDLGGGDEKG